MIASSGSIDQGSEPQDMNKLVQTLEDLISELDEEGIQFLIHQAQVLLHNRRVREINEKIAASKAGGAKRETTDDAKAAKKSQHKSEIEIVERGEGKHFFIVVRGFRIYFTLDEMKKLVKICHVAQDASDAAMRLYNWFKRFRSDFLVDGDIGSAGNPYLGDLYRKLISTYKVGEGS
jgi:hypothetical protein